MARPPREAGTYAFLFRLDPGRYTVGALGEQALAGGCYLYVGSAFGPGGLRSRVERHWTAGGRPRWHLDYLRPRVPLAVWYTTDQRRREALWARVAAALPGARPAVVGFGASDRPGATHLFRLAERPSLDEFRARLARRAPRHAPVEAWTGEDLPNPPNGEP
ncbi:MAG: GIY-YIG nuclease family protein [Pseudomonadota bacterium]